MKLPIIDETIKDKRVFVRGDIDIPLNPLDDTRLKDIFPTIEFLLKQDCKIILAGHLGRPGGKVVPELSSKPVADWFAAKVGDKVQVLENLRFDPREEANNEDFARQLAGMAEVYVNEAFATSWETHASIVGVPKLLPHYGGFRLVKEVEVLGAVLEHPRHPFLAIIGGAKVESKIPVIVNLAKLADKVLIGGKIVTEVFDYAMEQGIVLDRNKVVALPLTEDFKDIIPGGIEDYTVDFLLADTIVWSGPFGAIEEEKWQAGTKKVVELIMENRKAVKIVGGGDTMAFINKLGVADKFSWVSSGGGSMLKFLGGEKLPGIEALLL